MEQQYYSSTLPDAATSNVTTTTTCTTYAGVRVLVGMREKIGFVVEEAGHAAARPTSHT